MPICGQCHSSFPVSVVIDGVKRNLQHRKFCLGCSPFGKHNTRKLLQGGKKCLRCGESDASRFYKNRSTLCKKCDGVRVLMKQREMKNRIVSYLGGKCSICGYNKSLYSLHLHHPNSNKDFRFKNIRLWHWNRVLVEIKKCVLLCGNCHGEVHEELDNKCAIGVQR